MKKITLFAVFLCFIFTSCEKEYTGSPEGLKVTVKQIDALCTSAILEIQEPEFKKFGEKSFVYNGRTYNGAFSATFQPTNSSQRGGINNNGVNNGLNRESFQVILSTKPSEIRDSLATCLAVLSNMPEKFYYVYLVN